MNILYFHQYFTTPQGAGGTRSYEMAQRLIQHGHKVIMICGGDERSKTGLTTEFIHGKRRGIVDGIDVIELKIPYSNGMGKLQRAISFLRFALRSIWLALTLPCDLVFATTTPLTAGIPGIAARWLRRKPFVFEVRDLWPELPKAMGVISNPIILSLMKILEWASYKSATRLIGLAPGIVEGIASLGIKREKIAMIPNGCDLAMFPANSPSDVRFPQSNQGDFIAVFAGAHGRANGLDAVLDAASVLKAKGITEIKLYLIGQGSEKSRLQKRAQDEGLDFVIFLDPIPKTKLAPMLVNADLGLQILADIPAFYHGTSPNKFFDYIAAGLPVLTNYPGWLSDLINQYDCGYTVPSQNPQLFAEALIQAANHKADCNRKGIHARNLADELFDRDILGEQFVTWLEQSKINKNISENK